jgi:hypothetical protein
MADYRRALKQGDVEAALSVLDPIRIGRSARAELGRQHRFWRDATIEQECTRVVAADVVEVYERVRHPCSDGIFRVVSLLREVEGRFRLIETRDAQDELLLARIPCTDRVIDPVLTRADAEVRVERLDRASLAWNDGCVAELTLRPAFEVLKGPLRSIADESAADQVLTLRMLLVPALDARLRQLGRFLDALLDLAQVRGPWIHIAPTERVVHVAQLTDLEAAARSWEAGALCALWVRFQKRGGVAFTRGLSVFALPEVEMSLTTAQESPGALRVVAHQMIEQGQAPELGATLDVGSHVFNVRLGRRGPGPAETYGRWGAVRLSSGKGSLRPPAESGMHPKQGDER